LAEPMMVYKEEGMVFVCCTKNDVWTWCFLIGRDWLTLYDVTSISSDPPSSSVQRCVFIHFCLLTSTAVQTCF
jgi:hypothetical protein